MQTLREGNIFVRNFNDKSYVALTGDGEERYGWDIVSRRMNISSYRAAEANPWSPDESNLFALKIDRRHMPTAPDYRVMEAERRLVMHDRHKPGGPYFIYQPAIIDASTGDAKYINGVDLSKAFVMFLGWSDDSRTAWFGALTHDFSEASVYAVDRETAKARRVLNETAQRAIRSVHRIYYAGNLGFTMLPDDLGFIWESERDGWAHFYHYSPNGKLVRRLTRGDFPVSHIERIDADNDRFYFTARPDRDRPYDEHLMAAPLSGGDAQQLTHAPGVHQVAFSPDGRHYSDLYSTPINPPKLAISIN